MSDEHFRFHKVVLHYRGEVEKFASFAANLFKKLHTKFHQSQPRSIEDITKKHFGLFFRTHCIIITVTKTVAVRLMQQLMTSLQYVPLM